MADVAFAACEALVRRRDPDRFFAALFAPAAERPFLFALYAFNSELAHVAEVAREPMIADIRLEWWRETVEGARAGKPRRHEVAEALAETLVAHDLPQEWFERMIAARAFDVSPEPFADAAALEDYADATSGGLMRLAARILGAPGDAARDAGIAYALAGLLRAAPVHAARGKRYLPDESAAAQLAQSHFAAARKATMPRGALPAFLAASLVPLYLKRRDPPQWRRQLVLLRAALRGRL